MRRPRLRPLGRTGAVAVYAMAMAYVEAAVVVYLRMGAGREAGDIFPLEPWSADAALALIELGREAATLLMIAAVAWLIGRGWLERLAWMAVVFGIWDIGYYAWLRVLSGWPTSLADWDLLFLLPLPWTGPVWAPVAVSIALVGFGLALAARWEGGLRPRATRLQLAGLLAGGLLVIMSFLFNAQLVLAGGTPNVFAWPVFAAGMAVGVVAALGVLRLSGDRRSDPD
jgi:hypothetical protein